MRCLLPRGLALLAFLTAFPGWTRAFELKKVDSPPELTPLPMHVGGRTLSVKTADGTPVHRFQWPGVYFEAAFTGSSVFVQPGAGRAIFRVAIDGSAPIKWLNPGPGSYQIDGLADGAHTIRLELVTECQGGAVDFAGFALGSGKKAPAPAPRPRQIEFIGDSHTVGYGNTSTTRKCTSDEVWSTTDTSQAFAPIVSRHYQADYRIHAISGRGIVRNYGGGGGDPLPEAYPFVLFDKQQAANDRHWDPRIIVIGLGTNDFSTPLKAGEKWQTRDELHADYERTYVQFVRQLRTAHPHACFVLCANDGADGEIQAEVKKVADQLISHGETRVAFVTFTKLEMTGCDWHPSLADHQKIAALIEATIDRQPSLWPERAE